MYNIKLNHVASENLVNFQIKFSTVLENFHDNQNKLSYIIIGIEEGKREIMKTRKKNMTRNSNFVKNERNFIASTVFRVMLLLRFVAPNDPFTVFKVDSLLKYLARETEETPQGN